LEVGTMKRNIKKVQKFRRRVENKHKGTRKGRTDYLQKKTKKVTDQWPKFVTDLLLLLKLNAKQTCDPSSQKN
jgi:hypothetical protein